MYSSSELGRKSLSNRASSGASAGEMMRSAIRVRARVLHEAIEAGPEHLPEDQPGDRVNRPHGQGRVVMDRPNEARALLTDSLELQIFHHSLHEGDRDGVDRERDPHARIPRDEPLLHGEEL